MSGSEIMNSLKMARKFALECNYDSAATFYGGIDQEIAAHISSLKRRGTMVDTTKWELLRVKVADEKNGINQLQAELQAVMNPVAAIRLDRNGYNNNNQPNSPAGNARDQMPAAFHQNYGDENQKVESHWRPGMYGKSIAGDDDEDNNNNNHEERKNPYGDPLKFGPGYGNNNNNNNQGNNRRSSSNNAGYAGRRRTYGDNNNPNANSPPPNVNNNNNVNMNNNRGKDVQPQPQQQQQLRKPPIPRFGGGGGGAGQMPGIAMGLGGGGAGVANNNNIRKPPSNNNNNNNKGPQKDRALRFVPRPGDEEFAAMIEGDILHGSSINIRFNDIAGQEDAKALLEEAVVYPSLMPDYYQGIRRPWKGILMYGPPGTGKTLLAKAVAGEGNTTFFNVSHATLTSKYRGDSEKLLRVLFEMARHYSPSTIFIDEIDALCSQRGVEGEHEASKRAKSMLLTQMDGVGIDQSKVVMVLGATNHPWDIDDAMRRRLEQRIYIPLPTYQDRIEIFRLNSKDIKLAPDVSFEQLSMKLEGRNYSGADITTLCRDAAMYTMRRFLEDDKRKQELKRNPTEISKELANEPVSMEDFYAAMRKVPSSVNMEQVKKYELWKQQFQAQI